VAGLMRRASIAGGPLWLLGLVWAFPLGVWAESSASTNPGTAVAPLAVDESLAQDALPPVGTAGAGEPVKDDENEEDTLLGRLRSDEPVSIESDEIEIVDRAGLRHLVFRREVKVVQGDVTLLTDHLEAFYPEGASQPDRLEATGNVRVRQGERSARCESATYLRQEQVIVCRGQAEILRKCDRVRGGEIRFDLERDTVRVVGSASVVLQAKGECSGGVQ